MNESAEERRNRIDGLLDTLVGATAGDPDALDVAELSDEAQRAGKTKAKEAIDRAISKLYSDPAVIQQFNDRIAGFSHDASKSYVASFVVNLLRRQLAQEGVRNFKIGTADVVRRVDARHRAPPLQEGLLRGRAPDAHRPDRRLGGRRAQRRRPRERVTPRRATVHRLPAPARPLQGISEIAPRLAARGEFW